MYFLTEMRPAELFFQMHLLVRELDMGFDSLSGVEFCQSAQQWVLRAIHTNPSCLRYWKVLSKLTERDTQSSSDYKFSEDRCTVKILSFLRP